MCTANTHKTDIQNSSEISVERYKNILAQLYHREETMGILPNKEEIKELQIATKLKKLSQLIIEAISLDMTEIEVAVLTEEQYQELMSEGCYTVIGMIDDREEEVLLAEELFLWDRFEITWEER